ncbi:MAG TPA: hypothetical protein VH879_07285 [Gemmatimonadales bacterium]
MTGSRWLWMLGLTVLVGCDREGRERASAAPADSAPPPDSLALRLASGVEVWFTGARPAVDAAGASCVERVMEIREGSRRTAIPLLYTGTPPRPLDDTTIEAAIWLNCRPGNVYRVDLRTGRPVRAR